MDNGILKKRKLCGEDPVIYILVVQDFLAQNIILYCLLPANVQAFLSELLLCSVGRLGDKRASRSRLEVGHCWGAPADTLALEMVKNIYISRDILTLY